MIVDQLQDIAEPPFFAAGAGFAAAAPTFAVRSSPPFGAAVVAFSAALALA